jgi:hypothetical protein
VRGEIVSNFVSAWGVPPRVKGRPKTTTAKDIEGMLSACGFEILRSDVVGEEVRSSYVKGRKG